MSKNFSAPKSAPNPASVTTISASFKAVFVALTLLQPWAILAKGPPWTIAPVCSNVWIRFGFKASFKRAAIAPTACSWAAVTGSPAKLYATTIFPRRSFKSSISSARQRIAMISDATVMTKWSSLTIPSAFAPSPTTTLRSTRSFMSRQRFHKICLGSMPRAFPCWIWLSNRAASRLFAEVMA